MLQSPTYLDIHVVGLEAGLEVAGRLELAERDKGRPGLPQVPHLGLELVEDGHRVAAGAMARRLGLQG